MTQSDKYIRSVIVRIYFIIIRLKRNIHFAIIYLAFIANISEYYFYFVKVSRFVILQ